MSSPIAPGIATIGPTRRRSRNLGERIRHAREHIAPFAALVLPEQAHGRIPRANPRDRAASAIPPLSSTPPRPDAPSAPARWAIEVSQVTTRSSLAIAAAASRKASGPASKSSPSVSTRMPGGSSRVARSPKPFCSEISRTLGDRGQRREARRAERSAPMSASGLGLPCQTMPILKPCAPIRAAHRAPRSARPEIGNVGAGTLSSRVPKARGRLLTAIWASKFHLGAVSAIETDASQDRTADAVSSGTGTSARRPAPRHHRQVAGELDRVAEAMIVHDQHALAARDRGRAIADNARRALRRATCRRSSALRSPPSRARNRRASDRDSRGRRPPRGAEPLGLGRRRRAPPRAGRARSAPAPRRMIAAAIVGLERARALDRPRAPASIRPASAEPCRG